MDLRVVKTKKSISESFYKLRKRHPLECITIKELCETALINKATFYLHYKDIYDLANHLEEELIQTTLSDLVHPEYLFEDPAEFHKEFQHAMQAHADQLQILFSGDRLPILSLRIESVLKSCLFEKYPDRKDDIKLNLLLTYFIHGSHYAYFNNQSYERAEALEIINEMTDSLLEKFL